jgi:hypothetical protein
MILSDGELLKKLDDLLALTDRDNYECSEDLAEELQDELEHEIVDSQHHYMIADEVEIWWARQD